jgi:hypothetical protein
MFRTLRLALSVFVLAAVTVGTVSVTLAGGPKVLDARLTGIPTGGLELHGLTGGGAPWTTDASRAKLFADGRLEVTIDGLVLVSNGTNPIRTGRAIVTCSGEAVARSGNVPFSEAGDATVEAKLNLPDTCLAPAVFFVGLTGTGAERWLAVTGT